MAAPKRVVIVGGGISGLSAAFALAEQSEIREKPLHCTVVEGHTHFGGKIVTTHTNGLVVEGGPDSFLTSKTSALDLCEKLGLRSQLISTNRENSRTFTYSKGRLCEFPQGLISMVPTKLGPLFRSGVVSWPGIVRMGADLMIPARPETEEEETLAEFFSRRLGSEAFQRLLEPLVAGIYAGDANELSVAATFPQFIELERQHGSLIKGALAMQRARGLKRPGASARTLFTTLRGGVGDLVAKLVERLSAVGVHCRQGENVRVVRVSPNVRRNPLYHVELASGETLNAEAVVFATPAYVSAELLRSFDHETAVVLNRIPYASTITISMAFAESDVRGQVRGFGLVVPRVENRSLIAATWSSRKWAGRAPAGQCLIRCYLGGRGREPLLERDDAELTNQVRQELKLMVGIHGRPLHVEIHRWPQAMPQYTCGHRERVQRVRQRLDQYPGLYVTGAAYDGIGVPDCIRDAGHTVQQLSAYLWAPAS